MKRSQIGYLLAIGSLFLLILGAAGAWLLFVWLQGVAAGGQTSSALWWGLGLLAALLLVVGFWMNRFVQAYFFQVRELNSQARLILDANPSYRVRPQGATPVRDLGETLNAFADRFQKLVDERDDQIRRAQADLETERNLLAALLSELSSGVLACNQDGQIILYNRSAHSLLDQARDEESVGGYVGLGRSVFGLLDRHALAYALDRLHYRGEHNALDDDRVVTFVTTAANGRLLRARMAEFYGGAGPVAGFILTLQDLTQQIDVSSRRDFILQHFTEKTRAHLANILAAIETIEAYPDMPPDKRTRLHLVIQEETQGLGGNLDATMGAYARDLKAQWRLDAVHGNDLLWALQNRFTQELGVAVETDTADEHLWLKIDSYTLMHSLIHILQQLRDRFAVHTARLRLQPMTDRPRLATLDLIWDARAQTADAWRAWSRKAEVMADEDATLTLKEVALEHGGEVWFQVDQTAEDAYFRLLLPVLDAPIARLPAKTGPATVSGSPDARASRPEYYDFDLFRQPGQHPELFQRPLSTLIYTAFDTETTGLNPASDEIISIGAVRIVNGRILRQEIFDQLVNPRRPIPRLATEVCGVTNEMVRDQPAIDQVLPRFARFAEETVLVAHNAAFDMSLLQRKEAVTGVRFANSVLDTLLLSAVVHPRESDHSLEAIAQRLGVDVRGRHTALGDALVTAEVFLGLLKLLQGQGIVTLQQALDASRETYLARVDYD